MGNDIKYTIDHDVIRKWVEARGGWPAKFRRIYFSRYVTRGVLPRVRWEEFFQTFEEQRLAFLYQEHTATGRLSHFFRFVSRRAEDAGGCSPPLESSMPRAEDIPAIVDGGAPQRIDGGLGTPRAREEPGPLARHREATMTQRQLVGKKVPVLALLATGRVRVLVCLSGV